MPGARSRAKQALSVLGFIAALAPGSASAQTAAPEARTTRQEEDTYEPVAEALFRSGLRAFDAGNYDAACASLWSSLRIDPKLGALLNLALCHEKQGRTAAAWLEYAHAAAWAAELGQTNRHDFAAEHGAALERQLFRVRLVLPAEPVLAVEVDGELLPGALRTLPLFLDPGDHAIVVSAPGRAPYRTILHVLPGANAAELRIPALAEAATAPPAAPAIPVAPTRDVRRSLVFALGAASLVSFGLGAVFGVEAIAKLDAAGACTGNVCGPGLRDQTRTREIGSIIGFGVGAAALGVGAAVSLSSPRRSRPGVTTFVVRPRGPGAELGFVQVW